MSANFVAPPYTTLASPLVRPVEVLACLGAAQKYEEVKDADGKPVKDADGKVKRVPVGPKTNDFFPGCYQWRFMVETLVRMKEKQDMKGKVIEVPELEKVTVSIWAKEEPELAPGDYVLLENVMVGSGFVWATGASKVAA